MDLIPGHLVWRWSVFCFSACIFHLSVLCISIFLRFASRQWKGNYIILRRIDASSGGRYTGRYTRRLGRESTGFMEMVNF
jgi:hypothetical protein